MGVAGFFIVIGMALFVKAKFNGISVNLMDIWTEFAGDGIQKVVEKIVGCIKNSKEKKKLETIILYKATHEELNRYTIICKEIKTKEEAGQLNKKGIWDRIKDKLSNMASKITEMLSKNVLDVKFIDKFSESVLFELDYETYLNENSETFKSMEQEEKKNFVELLALVVNIYRKDIFAKTSDEARVMASIVVSSLKLYMDNIEENIVTRILAWFEGVSSEGQGINLQSIQLAKYTPKYILNSCPECGYNGPRIYTNEKTNTTYCAACGSSYSVLKYCEPELWQEINSKIDNLKDEFNATREQLLEGVEQVVTKEYLNACMESNAELMSSIRIDIKKSYREYSAQLNSLLKQNKSITEAITEVNEQNKKYNEFLSVKLDSLGAQISKIYDYARQEFAEVGAKSDLILEYVQKSVTKECLEETANALGANIQMAISLEAQEVRAVTTTGVAQILTSIRNLKEDLSKPGVDSESFNMEKIEEALRNENVKLSGKIAGLQQLVESNNEMNRDTLHRVIEMQDDIKYIRLAASLNMGKGEFEKLYSGKIPSRYLYNEGFGGPFPCPYCGVEEERVINDEQYCRCSVCGQKFLAVNPFAAKDFSEKDIWDFLDKRYGRDFKDPFLATADRVKEWETKHTAKIEGQALKMCEANDNCLILPEPKELFGSGSDTQETILKKVRLNQKMESAIHILIIPYGYTDNNLKNFLNRFRMLQKLVFKMENGRSALENTTSVANLSNVKIYGRTNMGFLIQEV